HPFHLTESDHKQADCPKCESILDPVSPADFCDVIVDRCPTCEGFWLDHGELERIHDVATAIDLKASVPSDDQKPAGWSALRWKIYLLKKERD
ncbi:zf-TFIIB domain-containing protein, partial [bacterium]|nr:zf-TFIIB domain-containing protein [bacterium]